MQGLGLSRQAQCQTQAPSHLQVGTPGVCRRAVLSVSCARAIAAWHTHSMCSRE